MARKVASFRALPPCLSVPTLPPSAPLQCRTPPPATHINAHSHTLTHTPCPPGEHRHGWVDGFPQLFKQIPTDGQELSSQGHTVALAAPDLRSHWNKRPCLSRKQPSTSEKHFPQLYSLDPETLFSPPWPQTSLIQRERWSESCLPTF